jgi:AcrR family transcriptional regulator
MPKVLPEYHEQARKKIIAAGLEVMSKKGYHSTTLDDIAGYVGVSKTTLYLYFKNKDDLVVEIVKDVHQKIQDAAIDLFHTESTLDAYTGLLDLFLEWDLNRIGLNFDILALVTRSEVLRINYGDHMNAVIERATFGIICLQKKGKARQDVDAKTLAISMIFLMNGVTNLILKGMSREEIRARYHEMGKVILGFDDSEVSSTDT